MRERKKERERERERERGREREREREREVNCGQNNRHAQTEILKEGSPPPLPPLYE